MKIQNRGLVSTEPIAANVLRIEANELVFLIRITGHRLKPRINIELNDDVKYQLDSTRKDLVVLMKK